MKQRKLCYMRYAFGFVCVFIILVNTIFVRPIMQLDIKIHQKEFEEAANHLLVHKYSFIYLSKDGIEKTMRANFIKDERLFNELLQEKAIKTLFKQGYKEIQKKNEQIYFYKKFGIRRIKGILYAPNGFKPEDNDLITKCISISVNENWYYIEER